jgi:hypothetical protein
MLRLLSFAVLRMIRHLGWQQQEVVDAVAKLLDPKVTSVR